MVSPPARNCEQFSEAAEAADEALALYRHVGDTAGENLALEVIATFQERGFGRRAGTFSNSSSSSLLPFLFWGRVPLLKETAEKRVPLF